MISIIRFLSIICIMNSVFTTDFNEGPCPIVRGQRGFDVTQIQGSWNGIKEHNWDNIRCFGDDLSVRDDGNLYSYIIYEQSGISVNHTLVAIPYKEDPAKVNVFLIDPGQRKSWGNWTFFYSNPTECFAVYTCENTRGTDDRDGHEHHKVTLLVLCRSRQPSRNEILPVELAVVNQGLTRYTLVDVDEQNC